MTCNRSSSVRLALCIAVPGIPSLKHFVDGQIAIAMIVLRSGQRWGERTTRSISAMAARAPFAKDSRPRLAIVFAGMCAILDVRLQAAPFGANEPPPGEHQPPKLSP